MEFVNPFLLGPKPLTSNSNKIIEFQQRGEVTKVSKSLHHITSQNKFSPFVAKLGNNILLTAEGEGR